MIIKKSLKFTLSAMLLAGGTLAYADGDAIVKLSNNTFVSWADFVDKLNNPPTVTDAKGSISDLPASNSAKATYNAALQKVNTDQADVEAKRAAVTYTPGATEQPKFVADSISAASQLAQAQEALEDYVANNVTAKKEAYENAEKDLATWNTELAKYNSDVTKYTGQVTQYTSQLTKAEKTLATAEKAYQDSKVTTETTTIEPWYKSVSEAADNYSKAWNTYMSDETGQSNKSIPLYYDISSTKFGNTLYISFVEVATDAGGRTWKTANDLDAFSDILLPPPSYTPITLLNAYVYLGEGYTNKNDELINNGFLQIKNISNTARVIQEAVDQIDGLASNYTTIETTETFDEEKQKTWEDAQAEVKRIEGLESVANENLTTANENVTTTEGKINGYTVTKGEDGKTDQQRLKDAYDEAVENQDNSEAAKAVTDAETKVTEANNAIADARAALTKAVEKLATDQEALEIATTTAQATADDLANEAATTVARAIYNEVELNGNVDADVAITASDYSGTIIANGNVITIAKGVTLFKKFTGHLNNAAINGQFATLTYGAQFENVVRWNSAASGSDKGIIYDGNGASTKYSSLGELGYATRDNFGVNFAGDCLATLAGDTKVYNITTYNSANSAPAQYVTVTENGQLASAATPAGFNLPVNRFAKSADDFSGIEIKGKAVKVANVFYGANNVCDYAVINDKANGKSADFYCPVNIEAKEISYDREFKAGYNTVCLPFEVNYSDNNNITFLGTYDRESFKDGKLEKFWFNVTPNSIPANTPFLLVGQDDAEPFTLDHLSGTILSSPTTRYMTVTDEGDANDASKSYGTFQPVTNDQFAGAFNAGTIFGLQGTQFKPAATSGVTFPAFRMVIGSTTTNQGSPCAIGLLDENGVEIEINGGGLSGIENVAADASSLNIIGGQGEINFTAEADYGKVEVYAIDGKRVAVANVVAGTTSVNLQPGIYIVMGKKVLVR